MKTACTALLKLTKSNSIIKIEVQTMFAIVGEKSIYVISSLLLHSLLLVLNEIDENEQTKATDKLFGDWHT